MPKGNIIDLEPSELVMVKIKIYAKSIGVELKTNQEIVNFAMTIANRFIEDLDKQLRNI